MANHSELVSGISSFVADPLISKSQLCNRLPTRALAIWPKQSLQAQQMDQNSHDKIRITSDHIIFCLPGVKHKLAIGLFPNFLEFSLFYFDVHQQLV